LNFVNEIDYFVTAEAAVRPAEDVQLR